MAWEWGELWEKHSPVLFLFVCLSIPPLPPPPDVSCARACGACVRGVRVCACRGGVGRVARGVGWRGGASWGDGVSWRVLQNGRGQGGRQCCEVLTKLTSPTVRMRWQCWPGRRAMASIRADHMAMMQMVAIPFTGQVRRTVPPGY